MSEDSVFTEPEQTPVELPPGADALETIVAEHEGEAPPPAEPEPEPATAPEPEPEPQDDPPSPEPPQETADERVARGLEALQARERELQEYRRELEQQRSQFDQEREQLERYRRYEELERRLHDEDALGALEELGVDFDQLSKAALEGRGANPTRRIREEIRAEMESREKALRSEVEQLKEIQRQRLMDEVQRDIRSQIEGSEDAIFTAASGDLGIQSVLARLQAHSGDGSDLPSPDQVIPEVEKEWRSVVDKLMSNEKVRQFVRDRYLKDQEPRGEEKPQRVTPTLTNNHSATVSRRNPKQPLPEDREDAIEAILSEHR